VTGIAPVTLHLHEKNLECAYEATKSFAQKNSALINFTGFWQNPPAQALAQAISIGIQSELNTFSVFIRAELRRNRARIARKRSCQKKNSCSAREQPAGLASGMLRFEPPRDEHRGFVVVDHAACLHRGMTDLL
jgi:hypothetical protein